MVCFHPMPSLPENTTLHFVTQSVVRAAYKMGKNQYKKPHQVIQKAFRGIFIQTGVYLEQLALANMEWPDKLDDFKDPVEGHYRQ